MSLNIYAIQENAVGLMELIATKIAKEEPAYVAASKAVRQAEGFPGLYSSVITLSDGLSKYEITHPSCWDSFEWNDLIGQLAREWSIKPDRTASEWTKVCQRIIEGVAA